MSGFMHSMATSFGSAAMDLATLATEEPRLQIPGFESPQDLYRLCRDLYYNEPDVYQQLDATFTGAQGYRNPVHGVVEFYVAAIFPGKLRDAFPLKFGDEERGAALSDRIRDIWRNSNWQARKQLYVRWNAMLGDVFIQAAVRRNSEGAPVGSYMALVDPTHVTNFEVDERDYLIYIRLDIPKQRQLRSGDTEFYYRTEEWSKYDPGLLLADGEKVGSGSFRAWESPSNGPQVAVSGLVGLVDDAPLSSFAIDFVPFVHVKFLDDGYPRGLPAPMIALRKSAEASRMASELHAKLFRYNQPDIQLAGGIKDPDGYVSSGPSINWEQPTERDVAGYRRVAVPPAGYELKAIDNRISYEAHQEAISAMMAHLQETDLPELAWYQRNDRNESGRALRIKLVPAVARAEQVRGNLESGQIRAEQMCLTLAQVNEIDGYEPSAIGTFEDGAFEHEFIERDILPMTEEERSEILERNARAAKDLAEVGISREWIMRNVLEMSEEEVAEEQLAVTSAEIAGAVIESAAFNRE